MTVYLSDLKRGKAVEVWRLNISVGDLSKVVVLAAYEEHYNGEYDCSITYEGRTGGGISFSFRVSSEEEARKILEDQRVVISGKYNNSHSIDPLIKLSKK